MASQSRYVAFGSGTVGSVRAVLVCLGTFRLGMLRLGRQLKGGGFMVYKWKIQGVMPVDAQTAGEEIDRLYQSKGRILPEDIVEASKDESAPLHSCFEWDDTVAAHKYRCSQASTIIRLIVAEDMSPSKECDVRAFVHVEDSYNPISVVVNSQDAMESLLKTAMSELFAFRRKYESLSALSPVFDAIEKVSA